MNGSSKTGRSPGWDLLRATLLQIPTIFGRLAYLSSLRNGASGHYEHDTLVHVFGAEDSDRVLRQRHRDAFSDWLGRNLEEQKRDLNEYLAGLRLDAGQVLHDLDQVVSCNGLIPPSAHEVERQLFITDLETILELLRLERGAVSWGEEA